MCLRPPVVLCAVRACLCVRVRERVAVRGVATAAVCLRLYLAVLTVLCVAIVYLSCVGVYIIPVSYTHLSFPHPHKTEGLPFRYPGCLPCLLQGFVF